MRPAADIPPPDPLDPAQAPPLDRYCDLVLTGGLTDGVVYPWAALELARHYRFKNIGGSSVGAMAAALVAAAEYARRHGHVSGFNEVLRRLPEKLGERVGGKTRLLSLFQPAAKTKEVRSTARLFNLFVDAFSPDRAARMKGRLYNLVFTYLLPILRAYWRAALLGAALALALGIVCAAAWNRCVVGPASPLTWCDPELAILAIEFALIWALLTVPGWILYDLYLDLAKGVLPNDFGLCRGGHVDGVPVDQPSLTEWLYYGIQGAARKKLDEPLTFEDLWEAPNGPVVNPMPPAQSRKKHRSIDLRMVTANLTHGRPYGLPLEDQTSRLFFRLKELKPFFPPQIIKHLAQHSKPYAKLNPEDPDRDNAPEDILELPKGQLPILVAARLSLSFPFLFSTVPLWAIDYEPVRKERTLRKCRFSDGGICSNFPIHMFDAAVPEWPTFGISLSRRSDYRKERLVWLPKLHDQGRGDSWDRFDEKEKASERLIGFLKAIVSTAKDWNDKTTARMPGVRDRIVHVFFAQDEGGLNLKVSSADILELARKYGQPAGKELVKKFIIGDPPGQDLARGWNEHRWVRFNSFLAGLRERMDALTAAAERAGYAQPMPQQIAGAQGKAPLEDPDSPAGKPLLPEQARELEQLLAALKALEVAFSRAVMTQPYQPEPEPEMRLRAPL